MKCKYCGKEIIERETDDGKRWYHVKTSTLGCMTSSAAPIEDEKE